MLILCTLLLVQFIIWRDWTGVFFPVFLPAHPCLEHLCSAVLVFANTEVLVSPQGAPNSSFHFYPAAKINYLQNLPKLGKDSPMTYSGAYKMPCFYWKQLLLLCLVMKSNLWSGGEENQDKSFLKQNMPHHVYPWETCPLQETLSSTAPDSCWLHSLEKGVQKINISLKSRQLDALPTSGNPFLW